MLEYRLAQVCWELDTAVGLVWVEAVVLVCRSALEAQACKLASVVLAYMLASEALVADNSVA